MGITLKKIIAAIVAMFVALMLMAGPATANGGNDNPADNKKVELCHATGSATNPYEYLNISLNAFLQAGHGTNSGTHGGDIYEGFSYTTKGGEVVNVPGKNTDKLSLLDTDCVEPKVDEKIAKPAVNIVDKCETADDKFSVAPGRGYTVGNVTGTHPNFSVTVDANDGFVFTDGSKSVTFTTTAADFPNSDDCDLPETGGEAQYNTTLGLLALLGVAVVGGGLLFTRRKRS